MAPTGLPRMSYKGHCVYSSIYTKDIIVIDLNEAVQSHFKFVFFRWDIEMQTHFSSVFFSRDSLYVSVISVYCYFFKLLPS